MFRVLFNTPSRTVAGRPASRRFAMHSRMLAARFSSTCVECAAARCRVLFSAVRRSREKKKVNKRLRTQCHSRSCQGRSNCRSQSYAYLAGRTGRGLVGNLHTLLRVIERDAGPTSAILPIRLHLRLKIVLQRTPNVNCSTASSSATLAAIWWNCDYRRSGIIVSQTVLSRRFRNIPSPAADSPDTPVPSRQRAAKGWLFSCVCEASRLLRDISTHPCVSAHGVVDGGALLHSGLGSPSHSSRANSRPRAAVLARSRRCTRG